MNLSKHQTCVHYCGSLVSYLYSVQYQVKDTQFSFDQKLRSSRSRYIWKIICAYFTTIKMHTSYILKFNDSSLEYLQRILSIVLWVRWMISYDCNIIGEHERRRSFYLLRTWIKFWQNVGTVHRCCCVHVHLKSWNVKRKGENNGAMLMIMTKKRILHWNHLLKRYRYTASFLSPETT